MAVVGVIFGFITSWKLSLVVGSVIPFLVTLTWLFQKYEIEDSAMNRLAYEKAAGKAEEVLSQIKTVASFANYKYEIDKYEENLKESLKAGLSKSLKSSLSKAFLFLTMNIAYGAAIYYGAELILSFEPISATNSLMSGGDVQIVLTGIVFGCLALGECIPHMKSITDACAAAYDFFELRDRKVMLDQTHSVEKPSKEIIKGEILFKNVSFNYETQKNAKILNGLNLNILAGKTTALVGESGCGKSTVISLIERLYDATDGEILIDNYPIKSLNLNYYRSIIGYVPQEPVLFHTSIKDNIIFGREHLNITDEMINEAVIKSHAIEFINRIEEGIEYNVGIRGSKLSGGQKQRIAIARAILTKPKFLLLDEATSALDNKSEKEVQKALDKVSKGVTTIIVAHRLSTIMNADQIVVLEDGKVRNIGNHRELLEKDSVYANIIKSQGFHDISTPNDQNNELVNDSIQTELEKEISERIKLNEVLSTECAPLDHKRIMRDFSNNKSKHEKSVNMSILEESMSLNKINKENVERYVGNNKKRIWPLIMKYKCLIGIGIIGSFFIGPLWPLNGYLCASAVAGLSDTSPKTVKDTGFLYFMLFILLAFATFFGSVSESYSFQSIGEYICKELRVMTYVKYLSMHMGFYDISENTPGSLLSKLASDTRKLNGISLGILGTIFQTISIIIISVTIGFIYDWRLSLINVSFLPLNIIGAMIYYRSQNGFQEKNKIIENMASTVMSESVCNTKTIFCYNMQEKVYSMYSEILRSNDKNILKSSIISGILYGITQFILFTSFATLMYVGGTFIADGSLNLFEMLCAIYSIFMAAWGLGIAMQKLTFISESKAAFVSVFKTFDEKSLIDPLINSIDSYRPSEEKPFHGKIEFKNVSFSYPTRSNQIVFENLNFTIDEGKSAAFVGFSGCGKYTIIQLIERFYDVTQGEIIIDGVNIKNYDLITLRHHIGLVGQEPPLFRTSVLENIRYGRINSTDEEVEEAAEKAMLTKLMNIKGSHKDITTSGGEKQRIAIARAILKDPKILLLDEATSALDSQIEVQIQKSLEEMMIGRTSIVIAHR